MISEYVQIVHIKEGRYKDFPTIKNGLRYVTYIRAIKEIPTTITLPEGIQIKILQDNKPHYKNDQKDNKQAKDEAQTHENPVTIQDTEKRENPNENNSLEITPPDENLSPPRTPRQLQLTSTPIQGHRDEHESIHAQQEDFSPDKLQESINVVGDLIKTIAKTLQKENPNDLIEVARYVYNPNKDNSNPPAIKVQVEETSRGDKNPKTNEI